MTKYIKGKDGKFQGSIGDGKTKVPRSIRPGATIATADLISALGSRDGTTVNLSDIIDRESVRSVRADITGSGITWMDNIQLLAGGDEQDSAERTATEHMMRMRFSTPSQFQEEVLSKKFLYMNPSGEYVFVLDNTDPSYASSIHYHPGYDIGFFEVITSNGEGNANSDDIPGPHLASIRNEIESRGNRLEDVGNLR